MNWKDIYTSYRRCAHCDRILGGKLASTQSYYSLSSCATKLKWQGSFSGMALYKTLTRTYWAGGRSSFRLGISFKERGYLKRCSLINMSGSINLNFLYIRLPVIRQGWKLRLSFRLYNFLFSARPHVKSAVLLYPVSQPLSPFLYLAPILLRRKRLYISLQIYLGSITTLFASDMSGCWRRRIHLRWLS